MFPTEISEESPLKQSILHRHYNPATEDRTQEQIEIYFAECHDVSICSRAFEALHGTTLHCADHLPAGPAPHRATADGPGRQPRPLPVPAAGQADQDLPGDCQVISTALLICVLMLVAAARGPRPASPSPPCCRPRWSCCCASTARPGSSSSRRQCWNTRTPTSPTPL